MGSLKSSSERHQIEARRIPGAMGASTPPVNITSGGQGQVSAAYAMASVELVQPVERM